MAGELAETPQLVRHVLRAAAPPSPAGAKALRPLLGIWKAPGGPYLSWSSHAAGGGHGARTGAGPPPPATLLSLGSSEQKPLAPGSPCPTALTNALNVVAKAPAVPPAAFTPRNNRVSGLIAAAGRSPHPEQPLPWTFPPPAARLRPARPPLSGLCLPAVPTQAPSSAPEPASASFGPRVVPRLPPPKLVGIAGWSPRCPHQRVTSAGEPLLPPGSASSPSLGVLVGGVGKPWGFRGYEGTCV